MIAVAGMPWLKVAVMSVVVYEETTPPEDLMVILAVYSGFAGKFTPVRVTTLPEMDTAVIVGDVAAVCEY